MKNRIVHRKDNSTYLVDEETLHELVETKKVRITKKPFSNGLIHYQYVMRKGRKK